MKTTYLHYSILALFLSWAVSAQVPKQLVVEHFTNTKCSICAARNPGFYTNLDAQPGVLRLAIHPSSPYSGCLLSQQNNPDNDARTNYYGVYGGTPRLVINGNVISSSANYSDAGIFSPYQGLTSPASIRLVQTKFGSDSVRVSAIVKTVAPHTLGSLSLFVLLAEDTVFYTGSNGEPRHFNVFRKPLSSVNGLSINLPATVGDSVVFNATAASSSIWNFNRINAMAILQESTTKNLVQAAAFKKASAITGIKEQNMNNSLLVYPNPGKGIFTLTTISGETSLEVRNSLGQVILQQNLNSGNNKLDLTGQKSGLYFLSVTGNSGLISRSRLIISEN